MKIFGKKLDLGRIATHAGLGALGAAGGLIQHRDRIFSRDHLNREAGLKLALGLPYEAIRRLAGLVR